MNIRLLLFFGLIVQGWDAHAQNEVPADLCQSIHSFRSTIGSESTQVGDICASAPNHRTLITLSEDTILRWNDFRIPEQHTLEFRLSGEERSVLNLIESTRRSQIAGHLESNGRIGIVDAKRGFQVTSAGNLSTRGLLLSTLDFADPVIGSEAWLQADGAVDLTKAATVGGFISGHINSSSGDLVIASDSLAIDAGSRIESEDSIRLLAAEEGVINLTNTVGETLTYSGRTRGTISNNGEVRAGRFLELKAPAGIDNQPGGILAVDPANGNLVLEVAPDRFIRNSGRIEGGAERVEIRGTLDGALPVDPNEGDNPSALIPAVKEIPIVARPSKTTGKKPVVTVEAVDMGAMAASAGQASSKRSSVRKIASVNRYSFFGYRGSRTKKTSAPKAKPKKKASR